MTFDRLVMPLAVAAFGLFAVVVPVLRLWWSTGTFAIVVHRSAAPIQRLMGVALVGLVVWLGGWSVLYARLGPEALGVAARPAAIGWLGWVIALGGLVLMVAAQAQMGASWRIGIDDRPTALVTGGLYAWARNPIYTGLLAILVGIAVVAPSIATALTAVAGYAVIRAQTGFEEQHLARLHGEAFFAWAHRVGRFVPWLGRLRR